MELSYKEWSMKIQTAFEDNFWIPEDPKAKQQQSEEAKLIHRRGIYKDTVGASHRFADYQFRPNLCVAMTVVRASPSSFPARNLKTNGTAQSKAVYKRMKTFLQF